jgi:hypothetical protein
MGILFISNHSALAASFSLSPSQSTLKPGQSFSVVVSVVPSSDKIYTSKVNLKYPAELLEVTSFSFASGWSPLSQPGYDTVDNTAGSLTKTAGYPGGLSSSKTFGTVTFKVKKEGNAKISVSSSSALYDENSEDVLSGSASSVFTISAPTIAPAPVSSPAPKPDSEIKRLPVKTITKFLAEDKTDITEATSREATTTSTSTQDDLENVASISESGDYRDVLVLILTIIVSFILGFLVGRKSKNW